MNRIIVTIRIKQKKEYDLELPVNQKIKDLMQDISDSQSCGSEEWKKIKRREFLVGRVCMERRYPGNTGI